MPRCVTTGQAAIGGELLSGEPTVRSSSPPRPAPWLDGVHTIFGEVAGAADQMVVDAIAQRDTIGGIEIAGDNADLVSAQSDRIEEWNARLR